MPRHYTSFYSPNSSGHRAEYISFMRTLLGPFEKQVSWAGALTHAGPVLFLMVEDSFAFYVGAAMLRSLWGRRTVGLLFRPVPALTGTSWRLRCKRTILRFLKLLPSIKTLTIVPFSIEPRFAKIADDGIYDLQLWDMLSEEVLDLLSVQAKDNLDELALAAGNRPIIGAIGAQDNNKGYDVFTSVWLDQKVQANYLFACGGLVSPSLTDEVHKFEQAAGFSMNRYISREELIGLYARCSAIWCYYADSYDQASGVLGRAIQFGIPVIVRRGSISHKLCLIERVPHISTDETTLSILFDAPLPIRNAEAGARLASRFRRISLLKLEQALGIEG